MVEENFEVNLTSNAANMTASEILQLAADKANSTMRIGRGGPFGAAIVKDGELIVVDSNSVLADHDPTAHAEVNAIRKAAKRLGTHDLSGCELYATGEPCPMCMSAIIWANIKKVHISGTVEDAAKIGFRDEFIYEYLKGNCSDELNLPDVEYHDRSIAQKLYSDYAENAGIMY